MSKRKDDAEPTGPKAVMHGVIAQQRVTKLFDDLKPLADEHGFVIGAPGAFGLELEVCDPVSGDVIIAARPHRRDIGQEEILMTPEQVVAAVQQARVHKDMHLRAVA